MRRAVVTILIIILIPFSLSALTIDKGRIRLELHEKTGRFSLYYLDDIQKEKYVSLLFERDPRTSSTGILLNNRIMTLGSSNEFTQTTEKTVDGARFVWSSPQLKITQDFRFVKSDKGSLVDGIAVSMEVQNVSEQIQSVGVHLLLDTHLGESKDSHFSTSDNEKIETETGYTHQMPLYWLSPVENKNFKGFQSVLKGNNITIPDRVVFSNWKRLSEALWNIEVQGRRNFNLLPYSINDSAVAQFYNPIKIASGAKRSITALFGAYNDKTFALEERIVEASISDTLDETVAVSMDTSTSDLRELARQDLIAADDIIANIDSLLSFPEEITQEKIEVIKKSLSTLSARKEQYRTSE
ncbi:MAG: hypothetical protein K9L66_11815 [Spirochaetaceae bacterium]|nr:hypothetical protein [Spirochaetaceae bacterium]MCF7939778.1 hypothetical protein [Spirochaetales bacterium]